jgi:predicted CxxxxCH...CXXCH cytochrome family protein
MRALAPLLCALLSAVVVGCGSPPLSEGYEPGAEITCTSCHGSGDDPAPPRALAENSLDNARGVGAHQQHLVAGTVSQPVPCDACHVVPTSVDEGGHADGLPAEITFNALAALGGLSPRYDRDAAAGPSCSNVYCHGGDRPDAKDAVPIWTLTDGTQRQCASCHGDPPPAPHPQSKQCGQCHSITVAPDRSILIDDGHHIDGVLDVDTISCARCHGSGRDPAPPRDLRGNTDVTATGVGAHQAHLRPSTDHLPVLCSACHLVPADVNDEGHLDDSDNRAEVTFSFLARENGLEPVYDGVGCSNVYCHGGDNSEGQHPAPLWTSTDPTVTECDSCHGYPPARGGHPPRLDCATCHGAVIGADHRFVRPELHVDGVLQVSPLGCDSCHGRDGDPAPPFDLSGNVGVSSPGVGAHQAHTGGSPDHGPIVCDTCHVVPETIDAEGHIDDDLTAEVAFSGLALAGGAMPTWDAETLTCSNTHCHAEATPVWTDVLPTNCSSCHGYPPALAHPARTDCVTCHADVVDAAGDIVAPQLHVDGQVQSVGTNCSSCHGSQGESDPGIAPPADTLGNTATSFVGVGAHQAHLASTTWHAPVRCEACHLVPEDNADPGHFDTDLPAEVVWSYEAQRDGAEPVWDGVGCSNVYCHGGTLSAADGLDMNPTWTVVDGSQSRCVSCHGFPPGGNHSPLTQCYLCHFRVYDSGLDFIRPDKHINGVVDVY